MSITSLRSYSHYRHSFTLLRGQQNRIARHAETERNFRIFPLLRNAFTHVFRRNNVSAIVLQITPTRLSTSLRCTTSVSYLPCIFSTCCLLRVTCTESFRQALFGWSLCCWTRGLRDRAPDIRGNLWSNSLTCCTKPLSSRERVNWSAEETKQITLDKI